MSLLQDTLGHDQYNYGAYDDDIYYDGAGDGYLNTSVVRTLMLT